ncbi:MAG: serine hydrolase domain-containing protein [Bacteroidota bacterium]
MKKFIFPLLILAVFSACEEAPEVIISSYDCQLGFPHQSDSHPKSTDLQAAFDQVAAVSPGMQVAVKTTDGNSWLAAAGYADMQEQVRMENCHPLMVGSISKTFTGVLIMQLHDEGILDVKDALSAWLGQDLIGEIANADQVSLEQLLHHTSGIRDYLGNEQYLKSLNVPYLLETQAEKLRYIYGKKAPFTPGERYSYSNTNYVLLGLVVEKARQMPLWDAVDMYIVQPLGLSHTQMGTHQQPIPEGTARPYRLRGKQTYEDIYEVAVSDAATGDGGMASNMQELVVFMEGLFGGKLMSDSALQLMITNEVKTGPDGADFSWPEEGYGLGISVWRTPYGLAYGHTGSTSSYDAFLFYFPDTEQSLAIGYSVSANDEIWGIRREMRLNLLEILFQ